MLNGIDPILIFKFEKLSPEAEKSVAKIPVVSSIVNKIGLPPIPIYLSQALTGLIVDSEEKSIDIETKVETKTDGETPDTAQKALGSTVKINLIGLRDSIGLVLLSAMCDLILPKITSKEYSITYLSGATTVFAGLLHSFSVTQSSDDNKLMITLEISKTTNKTEEKKGVPEVKPIDEAANLDTGAVSPTAPLPNKLTGPGAGVSRPSQPPIKLNNAG